MTYMLTRPLFQSLYLIESSRTTKTTMMYLLRESGPVNKPTASACAVLRSVSAIGEKRSWPLELARVFLIGPSTLDRGAMMITETILLVRTMEW